MDSWICSCGRHSESLSLHFYVFDDKSFLNHFENISSYLWSRFVFTQGLSWHYFFPFWPDYWSGFALLFPLFEPEYLQNNAQFFYSFELWWWHTVSLVWLITVLRVGGMCHLSLSLMIKYRELVIRSFSCQRRGCSSHRDIRIFY